MVLFFIFIVWPLSIFIRGFCLLYLWGWFIVPFGIQEISFAHGLGLSLLIGFLTTHLINDEETKDEKISKRISEAIGKVIFAPMFVLGVAYIIHLFM